MVLCLKGGHDVTATVFAEKFHFFPPLFICICLQQRVLDPPPPPYLLSLSRMWTESPIPRTPAPPLMTPLCGAVSLAWAAAGSLTPLIQMRMSIKRAQEFIAQVPTSKGQCGSACLSACMCLCTCVCKGERERERHGGQEHALVLHVSSHFQLLCQVKRCCRKIPKQRTHCRIPLRVRFPHSSACCTENADRGKPRRAPLLSPLAELPALANSI